MSKKPGPSYASVTIAPRTKTPPASEPEAGPPADRPARRLMRHDAAPMTVYIHPEARKAFKRYALEQDVKVHDLALEAFEDWFRAHGLDVTVRVQPPDGEK